MSYEYITVAREDGVGIVTLNRPKILNALNLKLIDELVTELTNLDKDSEIRTILLTGNEKAFAAGADINEMAEASAIEIMKRDQFAVWDRISLISKPIIGAVSGFALGGGCELMMNCDIVIASETAVIGQPEIKLGVMPGAGGTQRLVRAVGLRKAMEMLLTGDPITAKEALQYGLVNRVVPVEVYYQEALKLAKQIAGQPPLAVQVIKKAAHKASDLPLQEGMDYERNGFYLLLASEDRQEGMQAFLEKRKPRFTGN
ncbi:enoyl-CoA hydratase-related protein [Brevibacillus centrosporus]|uniref:Enoyl-CoA hydratase n=1 Tax=Brevibacillus centrosporus TaxID=54910 RepID=A0A1I4AGB9_9BACL|nr:enoyl-CoA hydratase-related protein [Brevibacillus centrosporus]MED4910647.1 enoyl-CoA hydratase-related protein [Brevibacillus centrosporus]SFK55502.1 enoyl-CoA hydratase [Brevibacillus centrosporus]